ncbi:MAG: anaerobic glycerol-3-phosphate dehydrogenase subunit C [Anaerolineales bacterium]
MTNLTSFSADLCLKCNLCTAACPVSAATDLFPGPKAVGPQFQRFRHPRFPPADLSVSWCSGCGVCSRVCPHGVPVTETNIQAKARVLSLARVRPRDWLLARPTLLADLGRPIAPLANLVLGSPLARQLIERALGIAARAPLPRFRRTTLRGVRRTHRAASPPRRPRGRVVAYFHGCSTDRYEWEVGAAAIAVLERLGASVILPPQSCCGLPLQSNGFFPAARAYARRNARRLRPFIEAGIPLVATSTSCSLALKHEHRSVLELEGAEFDLLGQATWDLFELLQARFLPALRAQPLHPVARTAIYHPPCQLLAHGIGAPATEILRMIPDLRLTQSQAECCGVAGTYGLKAEQFEVAREVGAPLFRQIRRIEPDLIITDSEACRWWTSGLAGVPAVHPVLVLATALGLATLPEPARVGDLPAEAT